MANYTSRHSGEQLDAAADLAGVFSTTDNSSAAGSTINRTQWKLNCKANNISLIEKASTSAATEIPDGTIIEYKVVKAPQDANGTSIIISLRCNSAETVSTEHPVVDSAGAIITSASCPVGSVLLLSYDSTISSNLNKAGSVASTTGCWRVIGGNKPAATQIQSDWTQTTTTALDYIKNKPAISPLNTTDACVSGIFVVYADSEDTHGYQPANQTGFDGDIDAYFYNTGIVALDADTNENYQYSYPAKSGTFAMTSDVPTNIENGTSTGDLVQKIDATTWTFVNSNSTRNNETISTGTGTGTYATSLGGKSRAEGKRSVAEGTQTIAQGNYSHAEGNNTITTGAEAHTEGLQTMASNTAAHAEGTGSLALGISAHAEGYKSRAEGSSSHAEGSDTKATNIATHAEGNATEASGYSSHAEGVKSLAGDAKYSGAFGYFTDTNSKYIDVGGTGTISISKIIDGEGYTVVPYIDISARKIRLSVETYTTQPSATNPLPFKVIYTVGGAEPTPTPTPTETYYNAYTHAEGFATQAYLNGAHAEGYQSTALGQASHAEGNNTLALGVASHTSGNNTIAVNNYETVVGKFNITDTTGKALFTVGNGSADGSRSNAFIVYNDTTAKLGDSLIATQSYVSTALGSYSTLKYLKNGAQQGSLQIEAGSNCTASNQYATALGYHNTASGYGSFAIGGGTTASSYWSFAGGEGSQATANHAFAYGLVAKAGHAEQFAIGKYNENKSNTLFEVGNGTSSTPSNAFEVCTDGTAKVGAMGTDDLAVATKKYVDDNAGGLPVENVAVTAKLTELYALHPGEAFYFRQTPASSGLSSANGVLNIGCSTSTGNYCVSGWTKGGSAAFKIIYKTNIDATTAAGLTLGTLLGADPANTYGNTAALRFKDAVDRSGTERDKYFGLWYQTSAASTNVESYPESTLKIDENDGTKVITNAATFVTPTIKYGTGTATRAVGDDTYGMYLGPGRFVFNAQRAANYIMTNQFDIILQGESIDGSVASPNIDLGSNYEKGNSTFEIEGIYNGTSVTIMSCNRTTGAIITDNTAMYPIDLVTSQGLRDKASLANGILPSNWQILDIISPSTVSMDANGQIDLSDVIGDIESALSAIIG